MKEYTIIELQQLFATGALTSEQLVKEYLQRIEQLNPKVNAIIEVNPNALNIAQQLDEERAKGRVWGSLHGIPLVVKDNIETDTMQTTAGSLALEGNFTQHDAFVVAQLRKAGAIILGKANLSEWANFRGMNSISGWSSRGGQTHNAYALNRNPSGSSSGSAVAAAANFCTAAIGTETDGSIISPSNANGVVGVKPTIGLISRTGIVPIAHTQDTAGPIARTVADVAVVLGAMIGADPRDAVTIGAKNGYTDYTQFLDKNGLQGVRLGIPRQFYNFNPKVSAVMENVLTTLSANGAELIDPIQLDVPDLGELEVLLHEFKQDLNAYLAQVSANVAVHSMQDVVDFHATHKKEMLSYFGDEFFTMALERGDLQSEVYVQALEKYEEFRQTLQQLFIADKLDALVAPSGNPAWLTDLINGDCSRGGTSFIGAITGNPTITVPAGYIGGLPVGVSFIGLAYTEPTLLRIAYAFEQHSLVRKSPEFKNAL